MSTGVGMSECCLSGKVQQGTPAGTEKQIGVSIKVPYMTLHKTDIDRRIGYVCRRAFGQI